MIGKCVTCIVLLTCLPVSADDWTGQDKAKHFAAGAVIASVITVVTVKPLVGFATGCLAGAVKEARDRVASGKDFAVTCLGAALGAVGTNWMIQRSGRETVVSYNIQW